MLNPIPPVFFFTLIMLLINPLAYAVRLVGVKTGRLAVSFALFNALVHVSGTSTAIQSPLPASKKNRRGL